MKSLKIVIAAFTMMFGLSAMASEEMCVSPGVSAQQLGISCTGSYYNWGQAQNGFGYCYEWACTGQPLNGGQPVSEYFCESVRPSYYDWGQAQNGWGYCYQYTANGYTMNKGQPVSDYSCEARRPSYYAWGRSQSGHTYCYQYTPRGVAMNQGQPVSDYLCR